MLAETEGAVGKTSRPPFRTQDEWRIWDDPATHATVVRIEGASCYFFSAPTILLRYFSGSF